MVVANEGGDTAEMGFGGGSHARPWSFRKPVAAGGPHNNLAFCWDAAPD